MGQSKAWLPFGPERMLQRVVRLVSGVSGPVVVVAAPGQELPTLPEAVQIARDPLPGRGPLQGLAAGLAALPERVDLAYATATDVPFLQPAWIDRLVEMIGDHDLAIPRCDGFLHPLAALYRRRSVLPACESKLQSGCLRPASLIEVLRARIIATEELQSEDPLLLTLRNLNTPEAYKTAMAQAGYEGPVPSTVGSEAFVSRVHVELVGIPRMQTANRLEVAAGDVGQVLRALSRAYPVLLGSVVGGEGSLLPTYTLNINGQRFTTDPTTPLREGDSLVLARRGR